MKTFELGDHVEIQTHDGAFFSGILMEVDDERGYLLINGCGFALGTIKAMDHV